MALRVSRLRPQTTRLLIRSPRVPRVGTSATISVTGVTGGLSSGGTNPQTSQYNTTDTLVVNITAPPDTTNPTLNLPANITEEATGANGAAVTYTATADDANPAHPTVSCTPASGSTFAIGTTTVNCEATDAAGNKATGSFTVKVQDTTSRISPRTPT